jgi:hypothetical protein
VAFKTPGLGPIALLREHVTVNVASFSGSPASDDWPELSRIDKMPARLGHAHDNTDYPATTLFEDSWVTRLSGQRHSGQMV